jgi:hypothetical protein
MPGNLDGCAIILGICIILGGIYGTTFLIIGILGNAGNLYLLGLITFNSDSTLGAIGAI